ncbi:MAG: 5-formyltetrahydrofolate cyclo-ligase, partial [Planctomycetota bacterium]
MAQRPTQWRRVKREMRIAARVARLKQPHKAQLSRQICRRLAALPEYIHANTVMFYVDFDSEVRTRRFLPAVWKDGKRVVVPYCVGERLELFYLESLDELAPGTLRILEPRAELHNRADRKTDALEPDLIVVPGVAFDRL